MLKKVVTLDHTLINIIYKYYEKNHWVKIFYPFLMRQRVLLGIILYRSHFCPAPTSPTRWIASLLQPDAVFIDGGGHLGLMSMIASVCVGNKGQVHTFEPQTEMVQRLHLDISAGKFSNITLNQKLLGEKSGSLSFFQLPGATVSSSVSPLLSSRSDVVKIECPAISLDEYWYCLEKPRPVDLIKLDVEGFEFVVLRGAKTLLQTYHPLLIVEIAGSQSWPDAFGYSLDDMLTYLSGLGYKLYAPQGYTFFSITKASDVLEIDNLLCIHEESRLYERAIRFIKLT